MEQLTLKVYLARLQSLAKENPNYMDCKMVYSIDDEGNAFKPVYYEPGALSFDERPDEYSDQTVICIN